jgi:hypothetical protein
MAALMVPVPPINSIFMEHPLHKNETTRSILTEKKLFVKRNEDTGLDLT